MEDCDDMPTGICNEVVVDRHRCENSKIAELLAVAGDSARPPLLKSLLTSITTCFSVAGRSFRSSP
jgi:hypothetical protein